MTEYLPFSHSYENAPKTKTKTKLGQWNISLPLLDGIMYILCSRKRSKSFTSNRGQKKRNISLTCAWFFWCSRQKGIKNGTFCFQQPMGNTYAQGSSLDMRYWPTGTLLIGGDVSDNVLLLRFCGPSAEVGVNTNTIQKKNERGQYPAILNQQAWSHKRIHHTAKITCFLLEFNPK